MEDIDISSYFTNLSPLLVAEIMQHCKVAHFSKGTELIREGQYVKVVPFVIKGVVKVFTRQEDKELLLYYIKPSESCVMSFSASLTNEKSRIYAITEEDSLVVLFPSHLLSKWVTLHPSINQLFFQQYNLRYSDLILTINHLLYDRLDKRLLSYLTDKMAILSVNRIKISHKEVANELGTAREVISRLVKKLEKQGQIRVYDDGIEVVEL